MYPKRTRRDGPPLVVIVLVGVLVVFGSYTLWSAFTDYTRTASLSARQVHQTQQAATENAPAPPTLHFLPTFPPTWTPPPPCMDFVVTVDRAVVRQCPGAECPVVGSYAYGTVVCVVRHMSEESPWYEVERDPERRSAKLGYMHQNVIAAVDPTPIPTKTRTPLPTVTPAPTNTLPPTRTPAPTYTPPPTAAPDSRTPSPAPTSDTITVKHPV